jgi:hypothetical protein
MSNKVEVNQIWRTNYRHKEGQQEQLYYIVTELLSDNAWLDVTDFTHVRLKPLDCNELPYKYPIRALLEFYKHVQ